MHLLLQRQLHPSTPVREPPTHSAVHTVCAVVGRQALRAPHGTGTHPTTMKDYAPKPPSADRSINAFIPPRRELHRSDGSPDAEGLGTAVGFSRDTVQRNSGTGCRLSVPPACSCHHAACCLSPRLALRTRPVATSSNRNSMPRLVYLQGSYSSSKVQASRPPQGVHPQQRCRDARCRPRDVGPGSIQSTGLPPVHAMRALCSHIIALLPRASP